MAWRPVRRGLVWTTDAPYRETRTQLQRWAAEGVLAVVSNAVDRERPQFDTGTLEDGWRVLSASVRAAFRTTALPERK